MMFPVFIDLQQKKCLVVGGGKVAFRKAKTLQNFCRNITVVAPEFCQEFAGCQQLHGCMQKRMFEYKDIIGMSFVVAATDNAALNQQIVTACNQQHVLVNAATPCLVGQTVAFPAVIKKGLVTIGINSGGNPALSKALRKRIEAVLPEDLAQKSLQSIAFRQEQKKTMTGKALQEKMAEHVRHL